MPLTRREIVRTMAEGVRLCLGEVANAKKFTVATRTFAMQCRGLVAQDPKFAEAVREEVDARLLPILRDASDREKVLTSCDPDHAYWLLCITDSSLRHFARHKVNPPEPKVETLIGRIIPMGPDGPVVEGAEE